MDHAEARHVLAEEISRYRAMSRADLLRLVREECDHYEVSGPWGGVYQVEVTAHWDNRATGDLRVVAMVDDGGLRAFYPVCDDFIVSADGHFIGG